MTALRICLIIGLIPQLASAQQPSAAAQPARPAGQWTVSVHDKTGVEVTGKLLLLDDNVVMIAVKGQERRFPLAQVRKVERLGRSWKTGALGGGIAGFVLGFLGSSLSLCEPPEGVVVQCEDNGRWVPTIKTTLIGAAVGGLSAAAVKSRKILYQSPTMTGAWEMTPTTIGFHVRW